MPQAFDLNFRQATSGGDINEPQALLQAEALRGLPHLILLLHGYNDDKHDADMAYQAFWDREQSAVGAGRDWAPGAAVVRVFWPGDARWWIASALFYPFLQFLVRLRLENRSRSMLDDLSQYASGWSR